MNLIFGVTIMLAMVVPYIVAKESEMSSEEINLYGDYVDCQNETGASDEELVQLEHRVTPTTKVGKCLAACTLNNMQVMAKEKFVPDNLIYIVHDETIKGSNGKTLDKVINEIADECKAVTDANECESAAKISICLNTAARKRGFCANIF